MSLTVNEVLLDLTFGVVYLLIYVAYRLWREHRRR
jgi:hypothetical protein